MDNEVDLAMELSKERKLRVEQTMRLHALMYEVVPYMVCVEQLIFAVVEGATNPNGAKVISESLKDATNWGADVKINLLANMVRPVGMDAFLEDEDICQDGAFTRASEERVNEMRDYLSDAAEQVQKDWDAFAKGTVLPSGSDVRKAAQCNIMNAVKEGILAGLLRRTKKKKSQSETAH